LSFQVKKVFNECLKISGEQDFILKYFSLILFFSISGLWTTAFYFGNFLGPTVAGVVVQTWGFRWAAALFALIYLAAAAADAFGMIHTLYRRFQDTEEGYQSIE
jgi:MFS family permease